MLYFAGKANPLQDYLQQALLEEGYPLSTDLFEAKVIIFSPSDLKETPDTTPEWLQNLSQKKHPLQKIIVLSSDAVYEEGDFVCGDCGPIIDPRRPLPQLNAKRWEVLCPICGEMLMPIPIAESSESHAKTEIGESLRLCENLWLQAETTLPCPVIILRLFQPYWASPSFLDTQHPLAVYCKHLLEGTPVPIHEDGNQMRDFTYGPDVLQALEKTIQAPNMESSIFNIASGHRITLQGVVTYLQEFLGRTDTPYEILENITPNAPRHHLADITHAQKVLDYTPEYNVTAGLEAFSKEICKALESIASCS